MSMIRGFAESLRSAASTICSHASRKDSVIHEHSPRPSGGEKRCFRTGGSRQCLSGSALLRPSRTRAGGGPMTLWSAGMVIGFPNLSAQVRTLPLRPFRLSLTVKMKAPPSVWLPPRAFQYLSATRWNRRSSRAQAVKRRVDGLLFRTDQPHLHFPVGKGEDLGPQHGRVGDADQLKAFLVRVVAGDDEEPGPVGGAVDVGGLDLPVDLLLFGRQAVEVQFGRRRQGLDDILQGVTHRPG